MSVIVKDMIMPTQCLGCEFCSVFSNEHITCDRRPDIGYYEPSGERPKWCPLKEQKKGKWIKISPEDIYECSECRKDVMTRDIAVYSFCHHCGARMKNADL